MSKTNNVHLQVVSAHVVNSRVLSLIFKHHIKTIVLLCSIWNNIKMNIWAHNYRGL